MTDRIDPERNPRMWLQQPKAPRACARCGASFIPPVPSTKYCSSVCRKEVEAARRHRRMASELSGEEA